jgi:hypothetical protein
MTQGIRGQLLPEPEGEKFRQYVNNVYVDLPYDQIEYDPFPTPEEAQIWLKLGSEPKMAFVPLRIVDQVAGTVKAALLGERGNEILVVFPPCNFGHTRFYAGIADLEALASKSNSNGTH